jgi:hypothetical protein
MWQKIFLLFVFFPVQFLCAKDNLLTDFPKGYTPEETGKRLAYRFVDGKHVLHGSNWISYLETFNWNGALKFAAITKDKKLLKLLQDRFEPLFSTEKKLLPVMNHVDLNMFGSLPLELSQITKDKRYKEMVMYLTMHSLQA